MIFSAIMPISRSVSEPNLMASFPKKCSCSCHMNAFISNLDLQEQIEALQMQLSESQSSLGRLEVELLEGRQLMDLELIKTREELVRLRERYNRLLCSHKKMQMVNNNLEDNLLNVVSMSELKVSSLEKLVADLVCRLQDTRLYVTALEEDNERFRSDCNTAVHMLQCKPSSFIGQRLISLPVDLQERVRRNMTHEQQVRSKQMEEERLLKVPIPTFPPTAVLFATDPAQHCADGSTRTTNGFPSYDCGSDMVPTALIAKVLTQAPSRRHLTRTYLCTRCHGDTTVDDKASQANLLLDHGILTDRTLLRVNGMPHGGVPAALYCANFSDPS